MNLVRASPDREFALIEICRDRAGRFGPRRRFLRIEKGLGIGKARIRMKIDAKAGQCLRDLRAADLQFGCLGAGIFAAVVASMSMVRMPVPLRMIAPSFATSLWVVTQLVE